MTETKGGEESVSRARSGIGKWVSICCSIFVIYALATMKFQDLQLLALFLAFSLAVGFVHYPLNPKRPGFLPFLVIDLILAVLGFSFALYIFFDYWEFIFRVGDPTNWDLFFGIISIVLIFELTRRVVGWPLLIIAFAFLAYCFLGQYLPAPFSHRGYDLSRIATTLFMSKNGLFGVP
ncbi:MAG: C4-dicarboxylate ABC transporter permease, partial [Deltaproteobacteria bacterium]